MIPRQIVLDIVKLSLAFGRVDRATFHEDGARHETDSDHTVMLGFMACALAARLGGYDVGLVAQFALVHDFPEVYAGDTPTLRISLEELRRKREREDRARARLAAELEEVPWVAETIAWYEARDTREARFVNAVDKLLPKLLAVLNGGAGMREQRATRHSLAYRYAMQRREIEVNAPELLDLWDWSTAQTIELAEA